MNMFYDLIWNNKDPSTMLRYIYCMPEVIDTGEPSIIYNSLHRYDYVQLFKND